MESWGGGARPLERRHAALNNQFRRTGKGGSVFLTSGIIALGKKKAAAVRDAVRTYDDFTEKNDPHGEHDFGAFELDGQTLFWRHLCKNRLSAARDTR
jgi:uncharacterized protein DUF3768